MANTITTRKMEANENGRGNLAGTQVICSCGYKEGTTMDSQVQFMVADHNAYHAKYSK